MGKEYALPREEPCTRPGCNGTALLIGVRQYMCMCGKLREVSINDLVDPNAPPKRNRGGRGGRRKRERKKARKRDKHLPH